MPRIFISYRRQDSQWPADRLYEAIKSRVLDPDHDVFIDVDDIPVGVNFKNHLDSQVAQCDVLLALIGNDWLNAGVYETGARRLNDMNDFVRIEIASALNRGIRVVPVLLDGALLPPATDLPDDLRELSLRNGVEIRRLSFAADTERLLQKLDLPVQALGPSAGRRGDEQGSSPAHGRERARLLLWGWILTAASSVAFAASVIFAMWFEQTRFFFSGNTGIAAGIGVVLLATAMPFHGTAQAVPRSPSAFASVLARGAIAFLAVALVGYACVWFGLPIPALILALVAPLAAALASRSRMVTKPGTVKR